MDSTKIMNENLQYLHLKLNNCMSRSFRNKETESQQIGGETVPKSANSIDIVFGFLVDIRELSHEELKKILVEVDAILSTVNPIPADQNLDATVDHNATKIKLKKILVDVFDFHNSLTKADAKNAVASTSFESRYVNSKVEKEKTHFYRKYKNKYNYFPSYLKSLKSSGGLVSKQDGVNGTGQNDVNSIVKNNANSTVRNDVNSIVKNNANSTVRNDVNSIVQNDVNSIVQSDVNSIVQSDVNSIVHNDLNDNTQNNINDTAQIDLNEKKYTLNDIIQNEHVYEMFKSRLKNSPYDDPFIKKNVSSSKVLNLKLSNGETVAKPMSYVAPLIMLKKCDDLSPIPLQNKEPMDKHFPSTSKQTNDSNITNSSKKMIKREEGANKTKDITNELPNDMDLTKIINENLQSFRLKLNYCMSRSFGNKKTESQQIEGKKVPKSANSIDIVTRFLVDIRELSHEELKNILVEVDAILSTVIPIPADQNLGATLEYNVIKMKLKKILVDVVDLLNSLTKADANNAVASTSFESRYVNSKVEKEKIHFYRKYKNKYNYFPSNLKSLKSSGGLVSKQDGVNGTGQNDVNSIVKNKANSTVRNDVNSIVKNNANSTVRNDVNSIVQNDVNSIVRNDVNSIVKNNANSTVRNDVNSIVQNDVNSIVQNDVNSIVQNDVNSIVQNDVNSIVQSDVNSIVQNDVNSIVQNDVNSIVQNDVNSIVQNDVNSIVQNDVNSIVQSYVNSIVHNDLNDNTQNNINDTAQIDLNEKKYTLNDIIQNEHVYEMFKSRLKNSPYDDSLIKKYVSSSKVPTLKMSNGETVAKPMSYVAPLIMLKKCDDLSPIPLQNKEPMDKHFPSTSKQTNDSNITNSSKKMIKREEGANKTKDITNDFKTITRKRRSTIKNSKYETSKKKKN